MIFLQTDEVIEPGAQLFYAVVLIVIAAAIGFVIWMIQRAMTRSSDQHADLGEKVTGLSTEGMIRGHQMEVLTEALDDHIKANGEAHQGIIDRFDRHLEADN